MIKFRNRFDNRALLFIIFAVITFTPYPSFAETLSLSTYYPAPFGVYNQIRLVPTAAPTCNANNDGLLWVDSATFEIMMCRGSSGSTASPWTQDSASPPNISTTDLTANVGIGTANPLENLQIGSSLNSTQIFSTWLHEFGTTGGSGISSNIYYSGAYRYRQNDMGLHLNIGGGDWNFRTAPTGTTDGIAPLTTKFIIKNSGNVGIGTTSPNHSLHIVRSGNDLLRLVNTNGGDWRFIVSSNEFGLYDNQNGAYQLYVNNGNVGIGTTGPSQKLDVAGNVRIRVPDRTFIATYNGTTSYQGTFGWMGLQLGNNGNNYIVAGNTTPGGRLRFVVNNTANLVGIRHNNHNGIEAMYIDPAGNVGINANSPSARLHVIGAAGANTFLAATNGGAETLTFDNNGDLRLVGGDMWSDAYWYNSDITLKENIEPVSGLDTILRLEGIQFNWKKSGQADVGLSAQNVEKVFPDLVATDPQTHMKSVKYGNLVAPLIEAIKEQQAQIEELQKRHQLQFNALRSEIEKLKAVSYF